MNKLKRVFTIAVLAAAPVMTAHAGQAEIGNISYVLPHNFGPTGQFFFNHDGVRTGRPACETVTNRWVINNTAAGKMQISVLLAAKVMNKKIWITGNGLCDVWADTETVQYFVVED
jgi:hypothetical protein